MVGENVRPCGIKHRKTVLVARNLRFQSNYVNHQFFIQHFKLLHVDLLVDNIDHPPKKYKAMYLLPYILKE